MRQSKGGNILAKATLNKRFEDLFRSSDLMTEEQLEEALRAAEADDLEIHQQVVDMEMAEAAQVLELAQKEWGTETINLRDEEVADLDTDFVQRIFPEAMAFRVESLPFYQTEDTLFIAMVDPFDVFIINEIRVRMHSRYKIKPHLAFPKDIRNKLNDVYGRVEQKDELDAVFEDLAGEGDELETLSVEEEDDAEIDLESVAVEQAQQSFVVAAVTKMLFQAIREEASDIHIEPFPRESILRYRIDGDLEERSMPNHTWHNAIISRIKIMGSMNIAERRIPQDGRIPLRLGAKKYELRVSIIPTVFQKESVVMRILDKGGITRSLPELGFSDYNLKLFDDAIHKPYGLILVCGPTGSGKSTTLFAALNAINEPETKILTAENPVEYNLPGIVQVQTREEIGLTFASALRAFLRQDPDVIMVGEMRDLETAGIGIQAALTGHVVFSTIHTNDAPSSVTRLVNLGIDPFLIGDSILLVLAQRLPQTLCKNCKVPVEPTDDEIRLLEMNKVDTSNLQLMRGEGCSECNGKGMKGRMAIHEAMGMSNQIIEAVLKGGSGHEIAAVAMEHGMKSLRQDGLEKAARGMTTVEEIKKITQGGDADE